MKAHEEIYRTFTLVATPHSCSILKNGELVQSAANFHEGKEWIDTHWAACEA